MLPYRKCSAIFLVNPSNGKIFAGERYDTAGAWQIPQGGVNENETYLDAAIRELREETGVTSISLIKKSEKLYKYDFDCEMQEISKKKYGSIVYSGQEVAFFVFEFCGDDSEINLSIGQQKEFSNWKWMDLNELLDSIISFKKEAFKLGAKELFNR